MFESKNLTVFLSPATDYRRNSDRDGLAMTGPLNIDHQITNLPGVRHVDRRQRRFER
jgi:hypothetical protein